MRTPSAIIMDASMLHGIEYPEIEPDCLFVASMYEVLSPYRSVDRSGRLHPHQSSSQGAERIDRATSRRRVNTRGASRYPKGITCHWHMRPSVSLGQPNILIEYGLLGELEACTEPSRRNLLDKEEPHHLDHRHPHHRKHSDGPYNRSLV